MSIIFMMWAFVLVWIKWGWVVGAGLVIGWLVLPPPSKVNSTFWLIVLYLCNLAIQLLGAYATALVLGSIWGAVVAVLVGVNAIVVWNRR